MIDNNKFTKAMATRSDAELIKILSIDRENYDPIAIEAAEIEFERRKIDSKDINTLTEVFETEKQNLIFERQRENEASFKRVSLFTRMQNFGIDSLVILFIIFAFILLLDFINFQINDFVAILFCITVFFFYYIFSEFKYQKTIGKYLTKTIVVKLNGEKPDLNKIITRTVFRLLPFDRLSFLFLKNGFHDGLSQTMVINKNKIYLTKPPLR